MPLMTVRAAAEKLGVGYSTMKRWIGDGRVRTTLTEGGHHRISDAEIDRLTAHNQPAGKARPFIRNRRPTATQSGRPPPTLIKDRRSEDRHGAAERHRPAVHQDRAGGAVRDVCGAGVHSEPAAELHQRAMILVSPREEESTLDHYIDHIEHVAKLIGIDSVGIGFDFFEFIYRQWPESRQKELAAKFTTPHFIPDLTNHSHARNLTRRLIQRGFSDADIENILRGNWLRIFKELL